MSDLPTPKYRIGDVVYRPQVDRTVEILSCPDCLGSRTWRATSPAGEVHTIACPRCTDQYARFGRDELPSLKITRYAASAHRIQIGSIRTNTHPFGRDDRVEYLTSTTGSGSIFRESELHPDEASALAAAEDQAAVRNAEVDVLPAVTRARSFSGLTYTSAAITALKDGIFNSWEAFRALTYAIEGHLPDSADKDNDLEREIREDLERYGKYGGTYLPIERHPIDALFEAFNPERGTTADLMEALDNLKRIAGIADHPENPPCTCKYIGRYSQDPDCLRHGKSGELA